MEWHPCIPRHAGSPYSSMPVHAPSITRVCAERFNGLMCVLMGISQHTDASLMAQSEFGFRGSEKVERSSPTSIL